jgi:hypothetical protein
MDSVILMGESLCRVDPAVSLHLIVPEPPEQVRSWAEHRREVVLSTCRPPAGVVGWDVKPWLLLRELDEGRPEVVWIDTDMIVTRPVSAMIKEFPGDSVLVAEEWNEPRAIPVCHQWDLVSARPIPQINACFVRVTQAHRPLLQRYFEMVKDPRYREAQALPQEARPFYFIGDSWVLTAILESEEFSRVPFHCLRLGQHIAQCAGSSGYKPHDRLLGLMRGLPTLIHCIGRKPWQAGLDRGRVHRFLIDLATDLSPYVLASRRVARDLDIHPGWLDSRTSIGALFRGLTGDHPGMAGLLLAIIHAFHVKISHAIGSAGLGVG